MDGCGVLIRSVCFFVVVLIDFVDGWWFCFFLFKDTGRPEIYTLSPHEALLILQPRG